MNTLRKYLFNPFYQKNNLNCNFTDVNGWFFVYKVSSTFYI